MCPRLLLLLGGWLWDGLLDAVTTEREPKGSEGGTPSRAATLGEDPGGREGTGHGAAAPGRRGLAGHGCPRGCAQ